MEAFFWNWAGIWVSLLKDLSSLYFFLSFPSRIRVNSGMLNEIMVPEMWAHHLPHPHATVLLCSISSLVFSDSAMSMLLFLLLQRALTLVV